MTATYAPARPRALALGRDRADTRRAAAQSSGPRLLVAPPPGLAGVRLRLYTEHMGAVLGGTVGAFGGACDREAWLDGVIRAARGQDLVILDAPDPPWARRPLARPLNCLAAERLPVSVLVGRRPRWPVARVLLVTRGDTKDEAAVHWVERLGRRADVAVTELVVIPDAPAVLCDVLREAWVVAGRMGGGAAARGRPDPRGSSPVAPCAYTVSCRLGSPEEQIRGELTASDPDLVVLAADFCGWRSRLLSGGLCDGLLQWAGRPVLVART